MLSSNDELNSMLACAKSEHELLEKNVASSFEHIEHVRSLLIDLHVDHDDANEEIALVDSIASMPCNDCDTLRLNIDDLKHELRRSAILLESANSVIDASSFTSANLREQLDDVKNELALLQSTTSLPCGSCESLHANLNELKLAHSTCVDELKHARAKIVELDSMPSLCSLL